MISGIIYRMMTKWHHDHLCTTLAAVSLYIDNYEVDVYDLGEDLKCDAKQYVLCVSISSYYITSSSPSSLFLLLLSSPLSLLITTTITCNHLVSLLH